MLTFSAKKLFAVVLILNISGVALGFVNGRIYEKSLRKTEQPAASAECVGSLKIDDLGINVPLYRADIYEDSRQAQYIVDREFSAAYIRYGNATVIADHVDQDFKDLKEAKRGMQAEVSVDGKTRYYTCTLVTDGLNTVNDITNMDGISIEKLADGKLGIYTCEEGWEHITLTVWEQN